MDSSCNLNAPKSKQAPEVEKTSNVSPIDTRVKEGEGLDNRPSNANNNDNRPKNKMSVGQEAETNVSPLESQLREQASIRSNAAMPKNDAIAEDEVKPNVSFKESQLREKASTNRNAAMPKNDVIAGDEVKPNVSLKESKLRKEANASGNAAMSRSDALAGDEVKPNVSSLKLQLREQASTNSNVAMPNNDVIAGDEVKPNVSSKESQLREESSTRSNAVMPKNDAIAGDEVKPNDSLMEPPLREEQGNSSQPALLQCVTFSGDQAIFHSPEVKSLLDKVEQEELCIVSVTGLARSGKSFLLSLLMNYLDYVIKNGNEDGWETECEEPIEGFAWAKGKKKPVTKGIWMFLYPKPIEKKRLLLLDCQGTSDQHQSTTKLDSMVIFYGMILSSLQIINVQSDIYPNDLDSLAACMLSNEEGAETHVYENLKFLIRDWPDDEEPKQLQERVNVTASKDVKKFCETILEGFEKTSISALPHPGMKVAKASETDGLTLKGVDGEFLLGCKKLFREFLQLMKSQQKLTGGTFFHKFAILGLRTVDGVRSPLETRMTVLVGEAFRDTALYFMQEIDKIAGTIREGKKQVVEEAVLEILQSSKERLNADKRICRYATDNEKNEKIVLLNHLAEEVQSSARFLSKASQLAAQAKELRRKGDEAEIRAKKLRAKIEASQSASAQNWPKHLFAKATNPEKAAADLRQALQEEDEATMAMEEVVKERGLLFAKEKERMNSTQPFTEEWLDRLIMRSFLVALFREDGFVDDAALFSY